MKKVLELYKEIGETPLETMERFRKENPEYKNEKMTYAGRLDPMAEGVLLVLVGEECKNKEQYLVFDKKYEFEILWGFNTDTYDILGLPQKNKVSNTSPFDENVLLNFLEEFKGKQTQKYPPYSSMTVKGKQLFRWAREGKLNEIDIPEQEVEVYDFKFLGNKETKKKELLENIKEKITLIKGDFRQEEIKTKWQDLLEETDQENFLISKFRIKCSKGTYVRGIVIDLGKKLNSGAVTFSIKRTKIS